MIQGSNYPLQVVLPFAAAQMADFRLTFVQGNVVVLTKTKADFTASVDDDSRGTITLTQEDTYKLKSGQVRLQLHYLLVTGKASSTSAITMTVRETDDKEVFAIE